MATMALMEDRPGIWGSLWAEGSKENLGNSIVRGCRFNKERLHSTGPITSSKMCVQEAGLKRLSTCSGS